jgi:hypothetical protein
MNRIALLLVSCVFAAGCSSPSPSLDSIVAAPTPAARLVDRATIRAELAAHRAQQVERLHEYAAAGEFPHNTSVAPTLHMFRDANGRYCAVANLVHRDGRDDLVEATVHDQNDLAIADVHDGPMMDWVLASGLTQEELVRVQMPAPILRKPVRPTPTRANVVHDAPEAMTEARMNAAVRAHVTQMEAELRDGTERSLDFAVERWVAHHPASS